MYARIQRSHGMDDTSLQIIFRSIVFAKLHQVRGTVTWYKFATATENHRIDAFINRCNKNRFVPPGLNDFRCLCEIADEDLFKRMVCNSVTVRYLPGSAIPQGPQHTPCFEPVSSCSNCNIAKLQRLFTKTQLRFSRSS